MDFELTTHQRNLISLIANKSGFTAYELETHPGSEKGDNYMGVISNVIIRNGNKELDLILKSAHTSESFRKQAPIRKAYHREIYIYEKIFVEFDKFQEQYDIKSPFLSHAKVYGTCAEEGHECVVLENLKTQGYQLWDRKKPMNENHISAVLAEYGKFHAVSIAMRHIRPEFYNSITQDMQNIFGNQDEKLTAMWMKSAIGNGYEAAKTNKVATEALDRFAAGLKEYFTEIMRDKNDEIVLNHGDCWNNNIMFRYEASGEPTTPSSVCLLDWQVAKTGSPASDLAYFFYSSSSKEALYDYQKYLKIYYKNLSENLRQFGCEPEKIFPYSLLESHWKKSAKYGLLMALTILKFMLSEPGEAPDLEAISEAGGNIMEDALKTKTSDEYNRRVVDIILFMVDQGWL